MEWNFDGLVGPTHNYSGLSLGNVASLKHAKKTSQPKKAALQGLEKMRKLSELGYSQGVLAPQQRPDLKILRQLGFSGDTETILKKAYEEAPHILGACFSASSMWTANAATISPSPDTKDGKVHITPANLVSKFHRAIEPETTSRILQSSFPHPEVFSHHPYLPSAPHFGDEGAANHTRFCSSYDEKGLEFFVFGHKAFHHGAIAPKKFPARQSLEASLSIARLHQLNEANTVFAQQNPDVIDEGVFHNDVISVGNLNCLFMHELAFYETEKTLEELKAKSEALGISLKVVVVPNDHVSVSDSVTSYLFNSQLLQIDQTDRMRLIAPEECANNPRVKNYLDEAIKDSDNPIDEVVYMDVKESMQNGGGPACLRLRVALTEKESQAINPGVILTDSLYENLKTWVTQHYRDEIKPEDLMDPRLVDESLRALDELTSIMKLGSVYDFQL